MSSFFKITKKKLVATALYILIYLSKSFLLITLVTNYFRYNTQPASWFRLVGWSVNIAFYIAVALILSFYLRKNHFSSYKFKIIVISPLIVFLGTSLAQSIPKIFFQVLQLFFSTERLANFSTENIAGFSLSLIFVLLIIFILYTTVCLVNYIHDVLDNPTIKKSKTTITH